MRHFFKQIHIWLSIPLGVVISVICFTGAVLIFEREVTESVQRDIVFVEHVGDEALPIEHIVSVVESQLADDVSITGVAISEDVSRAYKVQLSKPKRAAIYVDQYSGKVLGLSERLPLFRTMFLMHRFLMDSKPEDDGIFWGKMIVGVSTLLMVVITITGFIIWIPKSRKSLKHRLQIKMRKGWHRLWYDMHVAGGFYATLLLLAMALTGLTWSFDWYRSGFYKLFGVEQRSKQGGVTPKGGVGGGAVSLDDTLQFGEIAATYDAWQIAYEQVRELRQDATEYIISDGTVSVKSRGFGDSRASDRYHFDSESGDIEAVELYADSAPQSKMRGWIYSVHVGTWGGIITRVMWFLAAMLGATLPLTGYYLWIRRKFCSGKGGAK